jgi:glycosyltransferase involved in cell wall biosynthesis
MTLPIYINGRFLTQPVSGVQRYAREIVWAINAGLEAGTAVTNSRYILLVPAGVKKFPLIKNIEIREVGPFHGHLWEQTSLAWVARDGLLLSLGNSGPVLHRRQIVVVHDAAVFRHPEFFSSAYAWTHRLLGRLLSHTARIGTVSCFSQAELSDVLGVDKTSIFVAPNGSQHLSAVVPDETALERFGLVGERYFITIGNISPNKNVATIISALKINAGLDIKLVIVGSADARVFERAEELNDPRVKFIGRQSDEVVARLIQSASALVFASLYEGFGIPPLEALAYGCTVIASDIPAVREVCGDAVAYFPPCDAQVLAGKMEDAAYQDRIRREPRSLGQERAARFSWASSAEIVLRACSELLT